jgi:protein-disulfide isomerase
MGTKLLIVILFVLSILTSSALTYLMINKSGHTSTNGNLKEELSKLIQENPEIIIDALRKAQTAKAEQDENKSAEAAGKLRPQLENSATDGQTGKKDADVVMVGFIDYNCGYCRKSEPDIEKLLLEDANLKFVMKDFPILGPLSVEKSKASIAIAKIAPEKWYDFYKDP